MKYVWRFLLVVWISVCGILWPGWSGSERIAAHTLQRVVSRTSASALPWYRLSRTPASQSSMLYAGHLITGSARYVKLQFMPVRVQGAVHITASPTKELPRLSRTFDQKQRLPESPPSTSRFGIRVEVESGYGSDDTFVGRLQHGTQFKGAHYALSGHWETTQGAQPNKREENIATHMVFDIDVTSTSKFLLDGRYIQSRVALPQLSYEASHKKSTIQAQAGYRINIDPALNASLTASVEDARFTDEDEVESTLAKYGGHLTLRRNWSNRNTISLDAIGKWEKISQEQSLPDTRYYGSVLLVNSFAMYDRFSLDTGVHADYYHSEHVPHINYHITPVMTARLHLFRALSWYVTYHPRLKIPDFTDLYIRKLYISVNPDLRSEKQQHYVELGFKQRFGEAFALNVGAFYHDSKNFIFQIDTDADNILEYEHMESVDFLGVRANLQMNYRERLVQNITYTYTTHHIFSEQRVSSLGDDFRNEILPYQPNHQVQASLAWKLPFGLTVDANGLYVSEQYRNRSKDQAPIGRRFFVNVEFTQRITETIQVFLAGRNLTDVSTYDIIPWLDSEEITSSRLLLGGIRFRF